MFIRGISRWWVFLFFFLLGHQGQSEHVKWTATFFFLLAQLPMGWGVTGRPCPGGRTEWTHWGWVSADSSLPRRPRGSPCYQCVQGHSRLRRGWAGCGRENDSRSPHAVSSNSGTTSAVRQPEVAPAFVLSPSGFFQVWDHFQNKFQIIILSLKGVIPMGK